MKLAYFVHDLTDPAVARRVRMLRAGGAEVILVGFHRSETPPAEVAGVQPVGLGRTYDGRMGHRAMITGQAALQARRLRSLIRGADAIMARTLEMLVVAEAARLACGLDLRLTYECLDIHRMMLSPGLPGRALRAVERALLRRCALLVVSSPAFLARYFQAIQGVDGEIAIDTLLLENKVVELAEARPAPRAGARPAGPPWRIGWLGAIRCRRSLDFLTDLARRRPDLIEVAIHGRPAHGEFEDFDGQTKNAPSLTFGGPYAPQDLPKLYGDVHFSWAIDFMEDGLNSAWLLPNRLYEGSRHGAVPIALEDVETGRYLATHGFGLRLSRLEDLEPELDRLTAGAVVELQRRLGAVPVEAFVAGPRECADLVRAVAGGLIPQTAISNPKAKLVA